VAKQGNVIGEGANSVTATNDPTAHAEIVAIRAACRALGTFQLTDCELYTTCEPCPMCLGAIYWARPARVFYAGVAADAADAGFDDAFITKSCDVAGIAPDSYDSAHARRIAGNFAAWKRQPNKTQY